MTALLRHAFDEAAKRSQEEQDVLAARLLAELAAEDAFDRSVESSGAKLSRLAREAIEEHRAGHTETLDPDRL